MSYLLLSKRSVALFRTEIQVENYTVTVFVKHYISIPPTNFYHLQFRFFTPKKDKDRIGKCFIRSNLGNTHLTYKRSAKYHDPSSSDFQFTGLVHVQNVQMSNGNNSRNV